MVGTNVYCDFASPRRRVAELCEVVFQSEIPVHLWPEGGLWHVRTDHERVSINVLQPRTQRRHQGNQVRAAFSFKKGCLHKSFLCFDSVRPFGSVRRYGFWSHYEMWFDHFGRRNLKLKPQPGYLSIIIKNEIRQSKNAFWRLIDMDKIILQFNHIDFTRLFMKVNIDLFSACVWVYIGYTHLSFKKQLSLGNR